MFRMYRMCVVLGALLSLGLTGCVFKAPPQTVKIPPVQREFRGVWVATVANIDWPSKPGLSVDEQKKEAIAILDKCKELNFNAVVFQVRPQADAMYESKLEPWSSYLTGKQGQAPDPLYDPLKFWVEEAHKRGLQLHAWFNPYRANAPANKGGLAPNSIVKAHPELVVKLGEKGYYWMNPALKGVQDQTTAVIMDVVKRYDIDGVHFDDYFYPYPEYNNGKDFPDEASYQAYVDAGGKLSKGDWRRRAVNKLIHRLYKKIKAVKPEVQFGISPFGIWRPGHPRSIFGFDQYDKLYADARLWFKKGWVDYLTPQLYWPISRIGQSYPVLVGWWKEQNCSHRHLWPGLSIGGASRDGGLETVNDIMVTRGMLPKAPGNILFSMKTLMRNRGDLDKMLIDGPNDRTVGPYKEQALVPRSPWLDCNVPAAPWMTLKVANGEVEATWKPMAHEKPFLWVIYVEQDGKWSHEIVPGATLSVKKPLGEKPITRIAVSAVDRLGNESPKTVLKVIPESEKM